MSDVYDTLAPEARDAVIVLPVGRNALRHSDDSFCWGAFGMCHDSTNDPWWNSWKAKQRDVFFFLRSGKMGSWEYVCTISMNNQKDEFQEIVHDLLLADIPTNHTNFTSLSQSSLSSSSPSRKPHLTAIVAAIGSLLGIWILQI